MVTTVFVIAGWVWSNPPPPPPHGKRCGYQRLGKRRVKYTILWNKRRRWLRAPTPPIIFQWHKLNQQIIDRWKGNLIENKIPFEYREGISIWRFCEQFSRLWSNLGYKNKVGKILTPQNENKSYIILKHVIWRFWRYTHFAAWSVSQFQVSPSPRAKPRGIFLKGRIPHPTPLAQRNCEIPTPGAKKCAKPPPPGQLFWKIQEKTHKTRNINLWKTVLKC